MALLACGWPNNKSYKWSDTKKLMSYGLEHYEQRDVSQEELPKEWFLDIPVEDAQTASLYGKKGQAIGTLQYQVDGEVVWKREICAKEEVRKVDYEWFLKRVGDAFFAL